MINLCVSPPLTELCTKLINIHRQGRKSSSDQYMRDQLRPLSLHLSFLSWLEPTQGENLGFNDTKGRVSRSLTPSFDQFLAQKQAEYLETTKDVGNQRLDFRFAY